MGSLDQQLPGPVGRSSVVFLVAAGRLLVGEATFPTAAQTETRADAEPLYSVIALVVAHG